MSEQPPVYQPPIKEGDWDEPEQTGHDENAPG